MAFGIDFRQTSGYVTDPSGYTYMIGDLYPSTRGGVTFGYTAGSIATRDRDSGIDARLAGLNREDSGLGLTIRIDLPASGAYTVRWAMGDASFAIASMDLTLKDNTSTLFQVTGSTSAGGNFLDANGSEWSAAAWPGSNTSRAATFASTIANLVFAAGTLTPIATIYFDPVVAGSTGPGYIGPFGWK